MTTLFHHAAQLVGVAAPGERRRHGPAMRSAGVIDDGAVLLEGDRIAWVGPTRDAPPVAAGAELVDCTGRVVLPAFVDSHTHLLFAGSREDEWEQRLQGRTYQQIAAAGGGILSTVRSVRQASKEELKDLARPRLLRLPQFGVGTVEVKSGYGLSPVDERKCLEAIADLNAEGPLELVPTFLGAHAVRRSSATTGTATSACCATRCCRTVARRGLAEFCDVFCETGVFSARSRSAS